MRQNLFTRNLLNDISSFLLVYILFEEGKKNELPAFFSIGSCTFLLCLGALNMFEIFSSYKRFSQHRNELTPEEIRNLTNRRSNPVMNLQAHSILRRNRPLVVGCYSIRMIPIICAGIWIYLYVQNESLRKNNLFQSFEPLCFSLIQLLELLGSSLKVEHEFIVDDEEENRVLRKDFRSYGLWSSGIALGGAAGNILLGQSSQFFLRVSLCCNSISMACLV